MSDVSNVTNFCIKCKKVSNFSCSRCEDRYCSVLCQQNDWQRHRYHCIPMPPLIADSNILYEIQYTQKIDEIVNISKINKVVIQQNSQQSDENNDHVSIETSESSNVSKLTEQIVNYKMDPSDKTSPVEVPLKLRSSSNSVSSVRVETKPTTIDKIPIKIEEPVKQATIRVQSTALLEPPPIITIQPATPVKPPPNVTFTVQPVEPVEPIPTVTRAAAPVLLVEPIATVTLAAPVDIDQPATTAVSVVSHQAACKPTREQLRASTALLDQSFSKTCTELYFQRDITYHKWPERKHIKVRLLCHINHQNFSIVEDNPLYDQHCNNLTTEIADYIKTTRETSYIPVAEELVLAKFEGDFYRAMVLGCDIDNNDYTVLYLDYGNVKDVQTEDMIRFPKFLLEAEVFPLISYVKNYPEKMTPRAEEIIRSGKLTIDEFQLISLGRCIVHFYGI